MSAVYYALYNDTGEIVAHGTCPEEYLAYQGGDDLNVIEVPSDLPYENTHYVSGGVLTILPDHAYSVSQWQIDGDGVDTSVFTDLVNPTRIQVKPPLGLGLSVAYYADITSGSFTFSTPVDGIYEMFVQAPLVLDEWIEIQVGNGAASVPALTAILTLNAPFANQAPIAVPDLTLTTTFNVPVINASEDIAVPTLNIVTVFNDANLIEALPVELLEYVTTFNAPTPISFEDVPSITYTTTFYAPVLPVTTHTPLLEFETDFNAPTPA